MNGRQKETKKKKRIFKRNRRHVVFPRLRNSKFEETQGLDPSFSGINS